MSINQDFSYSLLRDKPPIRLLIEASAGTGKTYTLERIILFYLIEKGYALDSILLVTFTNKATRELRSRIQAIISMVLTEPLEAERIIAEIGAKPIPDWRDHLRQELANFAQAPIYTIHGFAQAMLKRYPMESESLLEARLDNSYQSELLRDFCRNSLLSGSLPLIDGTVLSGSRLNLCLSQAMAILGCKNGEAFFGEVQEIIKKGWFSPELFLQEIPGSPSIAQAWSAIQSHWAILEQILPDKPNALDPGLDWSPLAHSLNALGFGLDQLADIQVYCQRIVGLMLIKSILAGLPAYKSQQARYQALYNYDDLIRQLHSTSQEQGFLLPRLQSQYRLVLIDEFQDTDQIQWGIFRRIAGKFGDLIAVGDPKQAIYGFRGADLNTYLSARSQFGAIARLTHNYRSNPDLVEAANSLFERIFNNETNPNYKPRLSYPAILAGLGNERGLESLSGQKLPALFGLSLDLDQVNNPLQELFQQIADAILALIGKTQISQADAKAEIVRASDICILVDRNQTASQVQRYLSKRGIPSQVSGQGNLLESREAQDIQYLLDAIANPHDLALVRRLALTRFFGLDAENLRNWQNSGELNDCMDQCVSWHNAFQYLCLPGVLTALEPKIRSQLLSNEGRAAARSLTNYRHIVEIFQKQTQGKHIPTLRIGLVFQELCQANSLDEQETLHLATDSDTVKIMTMHSAKGLEFPIVFLVSKLTNPKNSNYKDSIPTLDVQTSADTWARCIDPWNTPIGLEGQERQAWEAWLRQFYVAITRARTALFLPKLQGSQLSKATNQLGIMYANGMIPEDLLSHFSLSDDLPRNQDLAASDYPDLSLQATLPTAKIDGWKTILIKQFERQSSFTSLASHSSHTGDALFLPRPEPEPSLEPSEEQTTAPQPGGTNYGTLFHLAMEYIDFENYSQANDAGRQAIVDSLLNQQIEPQSVGMRFGLDFPNFRSIRESLSRHIHLAMMAELPYQPGQTFVVHSLSGKMAMREANFHARLPKFSNLVLPERLGIPGKSIDAGFLNGSIDFLVPVGQQWCVIDWKTNRQGNGTDQDLAQVMQDNEYYLQALIYLSAVHQWQCKRQKTAWDPTQDKNHAAAKSIFENSIGPVWYVFARYGKALPVAISWTELCDFQKNLGLYANA